MLGPISGKYFKQLKEIVNNLSLQESVIFLGPQTRDKMPQLYRNACLSIVPSKGYEGTSIAALESMAVGCPCASTNIGGLKDLPTEKFNEVDELTEIMHNYPVFNREKIAEKVKSFSPTSWNSQWIDLLGLER